MAESIPWDRARCGGGRDAPSMTDAMALTPASMPAPKLPSRKCGPDDVVQDLPRPGVGEPILQAVADLDPHAALLPGHHEEGAVVDALAAELPRLEDAHRVVLDRIALEAVHREDGDLGARPPLEVLELGLDAVADRRGHDPRPVVHPRGEERHRLRGQDGRGGEEEGEAGEREDRRDARGSAAPPARLPGARASLAAQAELAGELVPVVRSRRQPGPPGSRSAGCPRRAPGPAGPGACRPRCSGRRPPTRAGSRARRARGRPGRPPGARTGRRRSGFPCGRGCGRPPPRGRPASRADGPAPPAPRRARGRDAASGKTSAASHAQRRARRRRQGDPEGHGAAPDLARPPDEGRQQARREGAQRGGASRRRARYRSERSTAYGTISPALRASTSRTAASIAAMVRRGEEPLERHEPSDLLDPASGRRPRTLSGRRSVPRGATATAARPR